MAVALLTGLAFLCTTAHAGAARYTAVLADGTRLEGEELSGWLGDRVEPKLDGRALFDPANPLRWLRENTGGDTQPDAFVEFIGGDCLPGRVVAYQRGTLDSPGQPAPAPPHLLVEPLTPLGPPGGGAQPLGVLVRPVRRIAWQASTGARYTPGTLFFRDGHRLAFRSLNFRDGFVRLVLDADSVDVAFDQIAELHLPAADAWQAHVERLALLSPQCDSRLVRIALQGGLKATASETRLRTVASERSSAEGWLAAVQPAWSLDPLYLPAGSIRMRHDFAAHELPLTWLEPAVGRGGAAPGASRRWLVDRNVQGGPLRSAGLEHGWGLGVHAWQELEFLLPASAQGFHTRLALDHVAGRGGCARGRILLRDASEQVLYESPIIVGSGDCLDAGLLPFVAAPVGSPRRLVLVADPVNRDRPAGADPLDIRDMLDWIEPRLVLDPNSLAAEVAFRRPAHLAAWKDWQVSAAAGSRWANHWLPDATGKEGFRLCVATAGEPLVLSRFMRIEEGHDCLVLSAQRAPQQALPPRIEVLVDGVSADSFEVPPPTSPPGNAQPMAVFLRHYRGRDVLVEVRQSGGPDSGVDWQSLSLVSRPWPLFRCFEDEPRFAASLAEGDGHARLVRSDKYSGTDCLKVEALERGCVHLPGMNVPIRGEPRPGEYRYLRFAMLHHSDARLRIAHDRRYGSPPDGLPLGLARQRRRSFCYLAGGPPEDPSAIPLRDSAPPNQWVVVTRDLYADFGNFNLTGFSLGSSDAQSVLFDHIYLARTQEDFAWIDIELDAERASRRERNSSPMSPSKTTP